MSGLIKRLKEERIQGSSAVLNYSNFDYWVNWDDIVDIVEDHDQPQLNENQQKYLKELQYNRERLGNTHDALFFGLVDYEKRWNFNDENFAQVLKIFANLALEQEEE